MSNLDQTEPQPKESNSVIDASSALGSNSVSEPSPAITSEPNSALLSASETTFDSASTESAKIQTGSNTKVSLHAFESVAARTLITFTSLLLALVLTLTLSLGEGVWLVALLIGVILALGVPRLLDLPHPNSSSVLALVVLLASLWPLLTSKLEYLPIIAVLAIPAVFIMEMARKGTVLRRLEQISGAFITVALTLSAVTFGFVPTFEFGTRYALTTVLVTAVVGLLHAFQTRSMLLASLLNGLVSGAAFATIVSTLPIWVGLLIGVSVAIIFWIFRQVCFVCLARTENLELVAYAALPFAITGPLALCFTLLAS